MRLYTPPSVCQISRQSDIAFTFYSSFCKCAKRRRKIRRKTKKLNHFLKSHISGTLEAILFKFGMWSTEVGGRVHSKNCLVSSRHHRAMEVRKLCFRSSCQYTHGCCAPASWAALDLCKTTQAFMITTIRYYDSVKLSIAHALFCSSVLLKVLLTVQLIDNVASIVAVS